MEEEDFNLEEEFDIYKDLQTEKKEEDTDKELKNPPKDNVQKDELDLVSLL